MRLVRRAGVPMQDCGAGTVRWEMGGGRETGSAMGGEGSWELGLGRVYKMACLALD